MNDIDTVIEEEGKSSADPDEANGAKDVGGATLVSDAPFLDQWRTSGTMFFLGLFCSIALGYAMTLASNYLSASPAVALVALATTLAYFIFVLVYALAIYPSLFSDRPKLKSKNAGSFLNAFVGGLIFGAIWCSCLTKKKKGVSQYVFAVLLALEIAGFAALAALNAGVLGGSELPGSASNAASVGSGASASSSTLLEVPESVKERYVGTWELVECVSDNGEVMGADRIEQLHQRGRDTFMNITEGQTVTFNFAGGYEFGVWYASGDADISITLMNEQASNISCDGSSLSFECAGEKYSFVKGEPKEAPFLFEYQEWMSPFLGSWHLVAIEQDGVVGDSSVTASLTFTSGGTATLTYADGESQNLWMATSDSTGVFYEADAYPMTIVDSLLIVDFGDYAFHFEKD